MAISRLHIEGAEPLNQALPTRRTSSLKPRRWHTRIPVHDGDDQHPYFYVPYFELRILRFNPQIDLPLST